jgi:hypothetical protein
MADHAVGVVGEVAHVAAVDGKALAAADIGDADFDVLRGSGDTEENGDAADSERGDSKSGVGTEQTHGNLPDVWRCRQHEIEGRGPDQVSAMA